MSKEHFFFKFMAQFSLCYNMNYGYDVEILHELIGLLPNSSPWPNSAATFHN